LSEETNTGRCHVCEEDVPTHDLLGHLRVMHPDVYGDGPELWPDGQVVILDDSLTPEDFQAEGGVS
jgi:hypothetical protein